MGADLAREFPEAREVFETADRVLGFSLSRLCWDGPEEQLRQTEFTQPAMVATSLAAWKALQARQLEPAMVAGHSVGEYAALAAAGVISVEECLRLVRRRGQLMQEAGDERPGAMAAVFSLSVEQCEELGRRVGDAGFGSLEVANINSPDQVVVSGDVSAIDGGEAVAREMGARRYIKLPVSAAFHSSLMTRAAGCLAQDLDAADFQQARFPVVANVSAAPVLYAEEVRDALRRQVASRVRWVESVRAMLARGIRTFVEVGAGTALAGMIRKIDREAKVLGVQDAAGVLRTVDALSSRSVQ
jgi:[acyl-carrier-protein] S-malonyltransferase